jgi:hypothetical protein
MATPKEALTGASQTININSNGKASPVNQSIGNQDTVTFKNNDANDAATVTFLGAGANEFNGTSGGSVTIPAGASSAPLTPLNSNVTVDYSITVGSNSGGPFSIQIGSGPLEIDIVDLEGDTNLPTSEIPNNGSVFFRNTMGYSATIQFNKANVLFDENGNSVTQQVVNANSAGAVLTGRGTNQDVGYTINLSGHPRIVETGSGSIKVGNT